MNGEHTIEAKQKSLIKINLAPSKNPSRWNNFKNYLKELCFSPKSIAAKKKIEEIIEKSIEGGIATASQYTVANKKLQAETEQILQQTKIVEDENRRKNSLFETELRAKELDNKKKEAEIELLIAEKVEKKTDSATKLLEFLESKGIYASLALSPDGSLTITMIKKLIAWK